jgi:putative membrane-bound dehydrogenase-like protein
MMHSLSLFAAAFLVPASADDTPNRPLPPSEAPAHMTVPEGFRVSLFAGEADVVQPIAFTFDDRGRLWVVECYSYPNWLTSGQGKDRVLIFEDKDGRGHFTSCKVFWDKGTNLSGIQVGFGGVWLCATPNLLFIPDRDGDDVPDGPPVVVLDGWDLKAKHNVFNSLTWGPDGWLYGCNGILSNSRVGKPGTPADQRVAINCGVWRYHPTKERFEVVANGTTNPWGLDFDDYGQMFITNCVIHHLWHVIPGAHFQRMYGQDFNPHLYRLMESCADHIHWGGGPWQTSRGGKGEHDQPGGGHAHVGAMVYLGDNWPERYRNGVFMCNLHGSRVNHDTLERHGSGYVAHHAKDFLLANDPWFRGLVIQYGPDGGVFVSDWTDTGECHNYDRVDRTNGRIYKVSYGQTVAFKGDLARFSDADLVKYQLHRNDWQVRHARRILQERAAAGRLAPDTRAALLQILREKSDVTRKLRAVWALHVTAGLAESLLMELCASPHESIRGWAVQCSLEDRQASEQVLRKLAELAVKDPSPWVRLGLASGLQRLPLDKRWPIAEALLAHAEDAADANLPLMIWYGVQPLAEADAERFMALIRIAKIPLLREFVARRASSSHLARLVRLLGEQTDSGLTLDVLRGMHEALNGQRHVPMPDGWRSVYQALSRSRVTEVREKATFLAVLFDDAQALASLRKLATDAVTATSQRRSALEALIYHKDASLVPLLDALLSDRDMRAVALRGLAAFSDPDTPAAILRHYGSFTDAEKADAIQTLASRPAYALALLAALEQGLVHRRDLSAFTVRQMLRLKDERIAAKLNKVWGTIRPASQEKTALMTRYKALLTPAYLKQADQQKGRLLFTRNCASCHKLFGEGGHIGPELTGSQRANVDYVLGKLLDPSAVVADDYRMTVLQTKDGRVITGIVKQENDQVVAVQTQNELIAVPKTDIEERAKSSLSMMPEGLLSKLKDDEVRDLIGYLGSSAVAPVPNGK